MEAQHKDEKFLERIEELVTYHYRKSKTLLLRKERHFIETPSRDLEREISELNGYLRGLKKSLNIVADQRNNNLLPLKYQNTNAEVSL